MTAAVQTASLTPDLRPALRLVEGSDQVTSTRPLPVALTAPLTVVPDLVPEEVGTEDVYAPGRTARGVVGVAKLVIDVTAAALLLLLVAPVLLVIAAAVRSDGGPVFFFQTRIGRGGREFRMVKFRSMVVDAERVRAELVDGNEGAGPLFKMRRDPRITRVGGLLRRYSIDELPQLLNVLGGQMSLIGPRPPLPSEAAEYTDRERRRLAVRPGMTGLWQVSGRSDLGWDESIALDLAYVDDWSLAMEAKIIAGTARAVLGGRGAY
ncbi:MAG: Exopolysaccharide biosynthesis polyprenyl glycosylphosphotransferase [uncultured Pseudonocardia sp.]|uniref:Exopolysaccharide biosynthesis polyprenyl glycosylphosphotransferase n=1 Tax=uncultured Pseudonocardia sp. TaxID=211455 RepID=A0A6J4NCD8_9PSEU|nr:MAG: Exopolysaccharide biosynthesis polyprenyl glycosylphosphotransferase [uncultured Pseudonocardia sp.]